MTANLSPGVYHIVFDPSVDVQTTGSVAIGNVQLEATVTASPQVYSQTRGGALVLTENCADGSGEDFRTAFNYQCSTEQGPCWYELDGNLVIGANALTENNSSISRRFATGNFNYRHKTVALNVVGTGVIDCSGTGDSACYGSGYLEYSLHHVANSVPINAGGVPSAQSTLTLVRRTSLTLRLWLQSVT